MAIFIFEKKHFYSLQEAALLSGDYLCIATTIVHH